MYGIHDVYIDIVSYIIASCLVCCLIYNIIVLYVALQNIKVCGSM